MKYRNKNSTTLRSGFLSFQTGVWKGKIFTNPELKDDFEDCVFETCRFSELEFKFTNFKNCVFKDCDFAGSTFDSVGFFKCSFPGSKLSFTDFGNVSIQNCNFDEALMENCIFQKIKGGSKTERKTLDLKTSSFVNTNLSSSVFIMCNLSEVDFNKSILESSVFEKCDLTKTDFTEAKLLGAGFTDCRIKETALDMNGFIDFGSSHGFILK